MTTLEKIREAIKSAQAVGWKPSRVILGNAAAEELLRNLAEISGVAPDTLSLKIDGVPVESKSLNSYHERYYITLNATRAV